MSELFGVYLLHVKSHAQKVNFSRPMNFEQHPYWGVNITFVCKRLFSWKLEYIFGEIYCLHQVISLGNEMATRSSCIKLQYVEENGCPNFRGLFTTKLIKSHVKLHVKSDAQTEVLGTQ